MLIYRGRGCHWWRGRMAARRRVTPRIVRDDDDDCDENTSNINFRTNTVHTQREPFMVTTARAMRPLRGDTSGRKRATAANSGSTAQLYGRRATESGDKDTVRRRSRAV